jgi:uncharacterized protein (TIGR03437 family)
VRRLILLIFAAFSIQAATLSRYALVLNDPPAALAGNRTAQEAARLRNIAAHTPVRNALRARGIAVASESHILLNAIFVTADSARLAQLQSIPGVRYVARVPSYRPSLDRAIQLLNVPAAWSQVGGSSNAGAGVKIAIIDSGIQSTHPAFQDPALVPPAGYPVCGIAQLPFATLDCTQYTNNKIIVARSYVPMIAAGSGSVPAANSRPDDYTPRDHIGHGTAVAMAAAGETNTGPADTITGVAPKAFLGSYKVFGSPGINDFTSADAIIAALEDAYYNDGMDIAVLSLGAPALFGPSDTGSTCGAPTGTACDPEAAAVQNAVNAGMIVVVAAGNTGPTVASINSPADAPGAIAVGALTNSHNWANQLVVSKAGASATYRVLLGAGPAPDPQFRATLSDASTAGDPYACSPLTSGVLTETYALVLRGTCTFATKVENLQAAGAAGALIVNNPGDDTVIQPGGLSGVTTIPAAVIGYDDGQTLLSELPASALLNPVLAPFDVTTGGQIASFSSLGPTITGALKPDTYAVGTDLYLAGQTYDPGGELYSASGYLVSQGTSFATPQIAGVAALVKQNNGKLSPAQIRSAVVDSASNAAAALSANVSASPATASLGILSAAKLPATVPLQLTNTSAAPVSLTLTLDRAPQPSLDRTSLTLGAGQSGTVNLSVSGALPAPGIYQGNVTVSGGATPLNIPYMYVAPSGIPWNLVPLIGNGDMGTVGQATSEGVVILQLTDQYGVPVAGAPVQWSVVAGGGSLLYADTLTDLYGLAGAEPILGTAPGLNDYFAVAGGLSTDFTATGQFQPTISANGVVDAAGFVQGRAVAPGSYIAIFGNNLAPNTQGETTLNLPVSIGPVSVSFDTATQSVPGHLEFVAPGQVNVQVPWELQGQGSAQMKVTVQGSPGNLYTLPLAQYSPGIFAIVDENGKLVNATSPALQGHNIVIYCNGLGPVTNQPASGDPSPLSPLAQTLTKPTVQIGNQTATVLFSGLTPTSVGLYQINLTVPTTGAGLQPLSLSIGGVTAKASNILIQ